MQNFNRYEHYDPIHSVEGRKPQTTLTVVLRSSVTALSLFHSFEIQIDCYLC